MAVSDLLAAEAGGVLTLTVNRPEKFNPLSSDVLGALRESVSSIADRADVKCVVIRGAGNRYFAAGGDLRELASVRTDEQTYAMVDASRRALDAIRRCPVPVVAVLNGDAIGGGAELAVACDFRLMREGAHIGYIQGRLAITSGWGGGTDLFGLVGRARALRMCARAELIPASLALDWGLADLTYAEPDVESVLADFLAPMLRQTPTVLRVWKAQAIAAREGRPWDERREIEENGFVRAWTHADHWAAADRVLSPKEKR